MNNIRANYRYAYDQYLYFAGIHTAIEIKIYCVNACEIRGKGDTPWPNTSL